MNLKANDLIDKITEAQWETLTSRIKELGLKNVGMNPNCKCGVYLKKAFGHNYCQGELGVPPRTFQYSLTKLTINDLPLSKVCRCKLREMAEDSINKSGSYSILDVIISILAWGGGGIQRQRGNWEAHFLNNDYMSNIESDLRGIWENGISRNSYERLLRIRGLGVSFVSKIIFFYSPKNDTCILDSKVAENIKKLVGFDFCANNDYSNYTLYNNFLRLMANKLGLNSPELVEILFFKL